VIWLLVGAAVVATAGFGWLLLRGETGAQRRSDKQKAKED
jgi:hypothetical protein